MNENNRLQLPGRVEVQVQFQPGMNADPVTVQLNSSTGIQVLVTGGESKSERHAVALLAGMLANPSLISSLRGDRRDPLAEAAVDMAYRVQAALVKRAEAESNAAGNGKLEI